MDKSSLARTDPRQTVDSRAGLSMRSSSHDEAERGPTAVTVEWTDQQRREYNSLLSEQHLNPVNLETLSLGSDLPSSLHVGTKGEDPYERPLSAPPPPGFGDPERRSRMAEEAIFAPLQAGGAASKDGSNPDDKAYPFDNLADVLGKGLAESMDDSSRERQSIDAMFQNKDQESLSLHRHARHTASRLIGASSEPFGPPEREGFNRPETFAGAHGFPAALSSPLRPEEEEQERLVAVNRSTTPVQLFPGQQSSRHPAPAGKDVGLNVNEPQDGDYLFNQMNLQGIVSQRLDGGSDQHKAASSAFDLGEDDGLQSMLNIQSKEFKPSFGSSKPSGFDGADALSAMSDPLENASQLSSRQCITELQPFLWGVGQVKASRTIAIYNATALRAPEVRSACENYGVLETFRADFVSRGIYFASFLDIRSAQYAAQELQASLQRVALMHGGSEEVMIRYCIPLNSSTQFDESQILISDLPDDANESALVSMLSSYGSIHGVRSQGVGSYLVEFHNLQDAKQALLELDSSQPWGPNTAVEVGLRNPVERRRGRELLSILSRWRQSMGTSGGSAAASSAGRPVSRPAPGSTGNSMYPSGFNDTGSAAHQMHGAVPNQRHDMYGSGGGNAFAGGGGGGNAFAGGGGGGNAFAGGGRAVETTQLIIGPDGRYTQVIVQNPGGYGIPRYGQGMDAPQQVIHGPNGQIFLNPMGNNMRGGGQQFFQGGMQGGPGGYPSTVLSNMGYSDAGLLRGGGQPYYSHSVVSDNISVHSGRSHHSHGTHGTHGTHMSHHSTNDGDNRHLLLDLEAVELGKDTRTSLMVRNIPNKYTQQMLLSEFTEHGHGPGTIDFFYLPIDFKNRCNRGYAFINFVDYKDILPFHQRYFGKHWRTFNSDKICDITYARIQGKAAMLKRFENSALMEKDDEYKPLVFGSEGPDRGKRIPFPDPHHNSNKSAF